MVTRAMESTLFDPFPEGSEGTFQEMLRSVRPALLRRCRRQPPLENRASLAVSDCFVMLT